MELFSSRKNNKNIKLVPEAVNNNTFIVSTKMPQSNDVITYLETTGTGNIEVVTIVTFFNTKILKKLAFVLYYRPEIRWQSL